MQLNRNLSPGDEVDTGSLSNPPSSPLGSGSGAPLGSESIPMQESTPSYILHHPAPKREHLYREHLGLWDPPPAPFFHLINAAVEALWWGGLPVRTLGSAMPVKLGTEIGSVEYTGIRWILGNVAVRH